MPSTGSLSDQELIDRSLDLAADLTERARSMTSARQHRRLARLQRLLASEGGTRLVFSLADRVLRPVSAQVAARALADLAASDLPGVSGPDRALLRLSGMSARIAPRPVDALVSARLRRETAGLVYPSEPGALGRRLARLAASGRRPNVNLLGEAILGHEEATRRVTAVEALLARADIDCVSVKVSSVAAGISLVDFDGSVERAAEPMRRLYQSALRSSPPKLVNLDMEEHRDLDLTVEVFIRVLGEARFQELTAGIALQAYLPDSHGALERILAWAVERRRAGGAPVRIRLVKGANLAMERVDAELHDWPAPTYADKAATDASYKAMLERLVGAAAEGIVKVGVASHNLFDVGFALVLADVAGVDLDVEMLAGMADAQAAAVIERTGRLLLYLPATTRADFRNALAYLARRLDENATPDGFLRHAFDLRPGGPEWEEQAQRFAAAVRERHAVTTSSRLTQDRRAGPIRVGGWGNEPDTDLTVPANRGWAAGALRRARGATPAGTVLGAGDVGQVDAVLSRAREAAPGWAAVPSPERSSALLAAAEEMVGGRGEAISVMAEEAGKTFTEADPEVSEAIDYARWYAAGIEELESLAGEVESWPLGVVVVSPPWNFPYAIPAGGVLAALAAGNTVILKPSPEAPRCSDLLGTQLARAGLGSDCLQVLAMQDGESSQYLVSHPDVDGVILTGSVETARRFLAWNPARRLLAETSGKNAMVVTATADVDQAVRDLVRSAFGHAGQKCSAASLAIVEASVHDHSPFLRQLADATRSLRVGPASDPASEVGPLVGPLTPALERALTQLDPGESWLVEPQLVDAGRRLWAPGVRIGIRPGSWAHLTEWFGPVLGVMRARDLDEATAWQNGGAYGLTAGLQSLDPAEHARWIDAVEAGNLYVNRTTTGALVGRQPFGGWKASSLGPTAKAGGPNYLMGLRRWRDAAPIGVADAEASYRHWWETRFGRTQELAGLRGEANLLRYRPYRPGVWVRVGADGVDGVDAVDGADEPDEPDQEVAKALAAAATAGTDVWLSVAPGRSVSWVRSLRSGAAGPGGPVEVVEESGASLADRLGRLNGTPSTGRPRLRLLGRSEPEVLTAAAAAGLTTLDEPVCSHGRIELPRWLREQSISRSLHRYGNVVYER
ncbi:MAG TPA: bifunctional proline dehydrogenase/L-glutamate gamma-semialdehyde dehydrogenase [Acidimicrobiales bacterium]|nr:bifunctional proline dehydrogenase/L-glutamate gamma-semialdehyde dehydrogenase [Acidimicrobiales bacterium]